MPRWRRFSRNDRAASGPRPRLERSGTVASRWSNAPPGSRAPRSSAGCVNATRTPRYRARFYSPTQQRFLSEDVKGFAGGDVNLFSYVSNSPITFVDPLGLDRTIWDWGSNGRLGPRNGNWGGDDWSGGRVPNQNGGRDGTLPPTDSADRCYMEHDKCYERCSDHRRCDQQLLRCLHNLPWNPMNWPEPPRPGTVLDTLQFMLYTEALFGTTVNGYMIPW